jgi:hypothetical protein
VNKNFINVINVTRKGALKPKGGYGRDGNSFIDGGVRFHRF